MSMIAGVVSRYNRLIVLVLNPPRIGSELIGIIPALASSIGSYFAVYNRNTLDNLVDELSGSQPDQGVGCF